MQNGLLLGKPKNVLRSNLPLPRRQTRKKRLPPLRARYGHAVNIISPTFTRQKHKIGNAEAIQKSALITAIKTPYTESGLFDIDAFDTLVEGQIENGVDGLIIGGTTGEGHLMSWDEHIMLIAHCAINYGNRINVIGNTGSNNTREAIHASNQGFNVGMDASLQINPYYGKTSSQGLKQHFKAALDCGPGIVYNVPSRTGDEGKERLCFSFIQVRTFQTKSYTK